MAEATTANPYIPAIGIECHVQLKTRTKLFAAVENDARGSAPNSLISHICVALPGALPVLNAAAIELSGQAALALNTEPQKFSHFERKHYFYPDLPKGYQITQLEAPIIKGGYVEIEVDGRMKKINIERANLEEDAGKSIHPSGADYSLVDLNRAGTPLLEIVSAPDISSPAEAKQYARELWLLMKYAGVTDGDLYHGHVRFDLNISLSSQSGTLGTRSEIKNLNSFRSVESAIAYEIKRQSELLDNGESVVQETRGWDEAKQKSVSQRGKEEAEDYRYMPEPDVPPLELDDQFINKIKSIRAESPSSLRIKLSHLGLDKKVIEDILDQPHLVPRILEASAQTSAEHTRRIVFQLLDEPEALKVDLNGQIKIAEMLGDGRLSSTAAKAVLKERLKSQEDPESIAERLNLIQVSDENQIDKIVAEVLSENQQAAEDVKKGETKAIGFLVGQVMQKSGGRANPALANEIIKKKLNIS